MQQTLDNRKKIEESKLQDRIMRQNLFVAKLEKKRKETLDKITDSNLNYNEFTPKKIE